MATTTNYAFPYPALSDAPNVPQDLQSLATAVDTSLLGVYNSLKPLYAAKATDGGAITSNTTLANDADLLLAVAASTTYVIDALIFYTAGGGSGAGQLKIGWTAPAGAVFTWVGIGLVVNGPSGTTGSIAMDASTISDSRSYGAAGTGTGCVVRVGGTLVVSSTAGNFRFQAAQVASSATPTTIKAGSRVSGTRMP